MNIDPSIYFIVVVPDGAPEQATPTQGFALSLCMNSHLIRATEPRLCTLVVSTEEADGFNYGVQVYSKDEIFFRHEQPVISDAFRRAEHLEYSGLNRPIDQLIHSIPGVAARDTSLDFLFHGGGRSLEQG